MLEKVKKNKKIIIIIDAILLLLLLIYAFISYYNNKHTFIFYDLKYDVPEGYTYSMYDDANFKITDNKTYDAVVGFYRKEDIGFNTIDELYENDSEKYKDASEIELKKEVINGIDMIVCRFLNKKQNTYVFESPYDTFYIVKVHYEGEKFDSNLLDKIITSLMEPKSVNK